MNRLQYLFYKSDFNKLRMGISVGITYAIIINLTLLLRHETLSELTVPGLDNKAYVKDGDILIGYLIHVYRYSRSEFCSNVVRPTGAQNTEIAGFIVDRINEDETLLPNITLGFVVFDDCQKDLTALARSIYFVPSAKKGQTSDGNHYKVAGIVGPIYSRQSVMVSSFLGLFNIPVLSPLSTSDELSDKSRFPFFMRLVSPDTFQAVAVVSIVEHFRWSYVSLLYSEGSYGENAAKHIERLTRSRDICLAVSKRLSSDYDDADMARIVSGIRANKDAPVVILFLECADFRKLFGYVRKNNLTSHFVWISGDTMPCLETLDVEEVGLGALFIAHQNGMVPGYEAYVRSLSWKDSPNPWRPLMYEDFYHCTWSNSIRGDDEKSCARYDNLENATNVTWTEPAKISDCFMVYAKAIHNLISDHCPELFASNRSRNFSACITGSRLISYMKNLSLDGYSGRITFDSKGDMHDKYEIRQVRGSLRDGFYHYPVGDWERTTNLLFLNRTRLDWGGKKKNLSRMKIQSICSRPCKVGQYYQRKEVHCCWECITCRDNEVTVRNMTDCQPCPDFTWPDNDTKTKCEPITPYYLKGTDSTGLTLLSLEILGVLIAASIVVIYIVKHNNKLIKATSKELSILILIGCMLACFVAMFFITYPDNVSCLLRQSGFHLVVCIVYSPLLTKTSRVYRIFSSGKKGISRPKFISSKAQVFLTTAMILIQVSVANWRSKFFLKLRSA